MTASYVGRTFGRFRIIAHIGAGGMGDVYRARDEHLGRDVAIKFLKPGTVADDANRRRVRREALVLSKLNHPNIATVHDLGHEDDLDFVVMEYIVGPSLAARIQTGPIDPTLAIKLARQIAAGLQEAHERGIIHRDLKPGNIMTTDKDQVKLVDFGLAERPRVSDSESMTLTLTLTIDQPGRPVGTLPYMAPEQLTGGELDARSDVWGFGVVLFQMVTGQRPFASPQQHVLVDMILNQKTPRPRSLQSGVPLGLERIIVKALNKKPEDRYQTAAEMGAALEALEQGRTERASWRREWTVAAGLAGVVAIGLGVLAVRAMRPRPITNGHALSVLVADVVNRTGEQTFDETTRELLSTSLEESHFLNLFPRSRVPEALRMMERPAGTPIDESVGREIVQRDGLDALVVSSLAKLGTGYVLIVRVLDATGRTLASATQSFNQPADLPGKTDAVVRALRTSLGESPASVEKTSAPLADVTSSSLEAVQQYTLGKERLYAADATGAIVYFQNALEIDPSFAMAHEYLGVAYTNLFNSARAEEQMTMAAKLIDRVPEAEKHKILADYNLLRRNYDEACAHTRVLTELRPLDPTSFMALGLCESYKFDYKSAIENTRRGVSIQASPRGLVNIAWFQFLSGDAATALTAVNEMRARQPGNVQLNFIAGKAELALGKLDDARRTYQGMADAGQDAAVEGRLGLADLALGTGRAAEAKTDLDAAWQVASERGNLLTAIRAASARADLATSEKASADFDAAMSKLAGTTDPIGMFLAGRSDARAGKVGDASRWLAALSRDPDPAGPDKSLRAMLASEIALAKKDSDEAVKQADAASMFEPSVLALETQARAYAAAGRAAESKTFYEGVLARQNERLNTYDGIGFRHLVDDQRALTMKDMKGARLHGPS